MNKEQSGFLASAAIIIAIVVAFLFVLYVGLNGSERVECQHWQDQAEQYPGFYLTQWQKQQCEAHNIPIDAPVR